MRASMMPIAGCHHGRDWTNVGVAKAVLLLLAGAGAGLSAGTWYCEEKERTFVMGTRMVQGWGDGRGLVTDGVGSEGTLLRASSPPLHSTPRHESRHTGGRIIIAPSPSTAEQTRISSRTARI